MVFGAMIGVFIGGAIVGLVVGAASTFLFCTRLP